MKSFFSKLMNNGILNIKLSISDLIRGIFNENPIFVLVLGMCPTLAVTTSVVNALGMGIAVLFVLICSNILVSILKSGIPSKIRIPCFIIIIASFTTIIEFLIDAFMPALHKSLGIFIPLIAVNCIIFARAESFAYRNNVIRSIFDGIGMGLGFTGALVIVGSVREILGEGTFLGVSVLPDSYQPMLVAILAPGAFITLGLIMALINVLKTSKA